MSESCCNNALIKRDAAFPLHSFSETLFSEKNLDLAIDVSEIGIDSLLEKIAQGVIPEAIPVVKTAVALGTTISTYISLKKLLTFIQEVQNGKPDAKQVSRRNLAAKKGERWLTKEVETVVTYLEHTADIEKVVIQAKLYLDYINLNISMLQFQEYLAIIDRLFLSDIPQIIEYYEAENELAELLPPETAGRAVMTTIDSVKSQRLEAIGILLSETSINKNGILHLQKRTLTQEGKYLGSIFVKLQYHSLQWLINESHKASH